MESSGRVRVSRLRSRFQQGGCRVRRCFDSVESCLQRQFELDASDGALPGVLCPSVDRSGGIWTCVNPLLRWVLKGGLALTLLPCLSSRHTAQDML